MLEYLFSCKIFFISLLSEPASHYVFHIGLELTLQSRLALNLQCLFSLNFSSAGTVDMAHVLAFEHVFYFFFLCVHLWYMYVTIEMHALCVHMQRPEQHVR